MTDGDNTWRAKRARTRSARREHGADAAGAGIIPAMHSPPPTRRGSTPPPLLFQVDTVDPWLGSHPGHEPHSAPQHEVSAAFEAALGPTFDPASVPLGGQPGRRRARLPADPVVEAPVVEASVVEASVVETSVLEPPVLEPPVLEPPVLEPPVLEPPVLEPLVLEPPSYVPPKSGPSAFIGSDADHQATDPTVEDAPTIVFAPIAIEPTFWSPPARADESIPPTPVVPTPTVPTPTVPVSLSKAAPEGDSWWKALQPEAPPFHLDPPEPPPPVWFDGHLDPFDFAAQFGTPDPAWAPPDGVDGGDLDGGGRHRIDGAAAPSSGRRRATKPGRKAPWWELPALVALAIIIAVVVKSFVVQPFYIPSPSMERTLHGCTGCSGDRILVNKPIYDFRDPEPGDIVVFNAPPGWNEEAGSTPPSNPLLRAGRGFLQMVGFVPPDGLVLVKRVIAVGGQTVKGVSVAGGMGEHIMISDHGDAGPWRTLVEPYVYIDHPDTTATFGPVTVPKGRLWVMGDHRDDSADSRFHCGPNVNAPAGAGTCDPTSSTVPVSDVIGKAFVIAWPPSRWRTLGTPSTLGAGLVAPIFFLRRRSRRRRRIAA